MRRTWPVGVAVLLLALGLTPAAARAVVTKSAVKVGEDMAEITPSKCDAVPENLVGNCGFETGAYDPWIVTPPP